MQYEQVHYMVDKIFALYEEYGQEAYNEEATMLAHMMKCARLAEEDGYDDEMIVAAFLHDVGHFLELTKKSAHKDIDHDELGARYLQELGFPCRIAELVSGHIAVKRFLTFTNPAYYNNLPDTGKLSLKNYGGPMNWDEAIVFCKQPLLSRYIQLSYWDDNAKNATIKVGDEDIWRMKEITTRYLISQVESPIAYV
ncbi:MAG: hypothetical protein BGO69_06935 [Bacteroidetes bacterium 46-16]|nr:MAG: hypothetical protein BGO69_06935 [Bacteroidetes bacterium 46-16]